VVARGSAQRPTLGITAGEQSRPRFSLLAHRLRKPNSSTDHGGGKSNPVEN
jgi:hypothetical protein